MEPKSVLACGLQGCIGKLWEENHFSDFTVTVDGTSYPCHRFILSACSSFFKGMFMSGMKECQENQAFIQGMTKETFEVILNSVYRGFDGLTKDNVLDVWAATVQLQIEYLIKECEEWLESNISMDNCFDILSHANMLSSSRAEVLSLNFITENFSTISKSDGLVHLSFDNLLKIVESDYLKAPAEDVVVNMVLKWVSYTDDDDVQDDDDTSNLHQCDKSDLPYIHGNEMVTQNKGGYSGRGNNCEETVSPVVRKNKGERVGKDAVVSAKTKSVHGDGSSAAATTSSTSVSGIDSARSTSNDVSDEAQLNSSSRKHHLFELMSACRLLLLSSEYLENLLKENELVLSCRRTYKLFFDAFMFSLHAERRHDCWPDAAIHRVLSKMKHVMVFVSNRELNAYDLNSRTICYCTDLPDSISDPIAITVFDNIVYLSSSSKYSDGKHYAYFKEKHWTNLGDIGPYCNMLLPHGQCLYGYVKYREGVFLQQLYCTNDRNKSLYSICELNSSENFLIRFQEYIIAFYTENSLVMAQCCNTVTHTTEAGIGPLHGSSTNMVSFSHQGNVYILQGNGSLWIIISTERSPVQFEYVAKLWNISCYLYGGVVYRKRLVVFCSEDRPVSLGVCQVSCPGIFDYIETVALRSQTQCLPIVVEKSCLYYDTDDPDSCVY